MWAQHLLQWTGIQWWYLQIVKLVSLVNKLVYSFLLTHIPMKFSWLNPPINTLLILKRHLCWSLSFSLLSVSLSLSHSLCPSLSHCLSLYFSEIHPPVLRCDPPLAFSHSVLWSMCRSLSLSPPTSVERCQNLPVACSETTQTLSGGWLTLATWCTDTCRDKLTLIRMTVNVWRGTDTCQDKLTLIRRTVNVWRGTDTCQVMDWHLPG